MISSINPVDLKKRLAANESLVLLDVRQPFEHEAKNIPNSVLIPLNELDLRLKELEPYKDLDIVVYCKAGVRSQIACEILSDNGYTHLFNLTGGMLNW